MTNSLSQSTNSPGSVPEMALRDVKPPLDVPIDWVAAAWWAAGIALALIALAAMIAYWIRKRRRPEAKPVAPSVPPHQEARRRLEAALRLISDPKPFCVAVSDALRWYLEQRFELRAPERTTEEFLEELRVSDLLNGEQKEVLAEFLQRCDLVKFARLEPNESELLRLHDTAARLVDETSLIPADTGPESPSGTPTSGPATESRAA